MIDRLLELFSPAGRRGGIAPTGELEIAVAALLVEAARMDDHFDAAERSAVRAILARRFGLDEAATARLLAAAEEAAGRSAGLYRFVHRITDALDADQRIGVVEMLWEVAYADGELDPQEDALIRRIAGLVHVSDRDRGAARLRVLSRRAG
ncbi:MAG: TerB family tellurite resistance protein [Alphaproteobacteria bacterium]